METEYDKNSYYKYFQIPGKRKKILKKDCYITITDHLNCYIYNR